MKNAIITSLILTVVINALADGNSPTNSGRAKEPFIEKSFPVEYANYEKMLAQENGTNDAHAVLELLAKIKNSLGQAAKSSVEERDRNAAYQAGWRLSLQTMTETKDESAQQHILDEWNRSLREDNDAVPSQIYALSEEWNRKLLTDDFWNTLQQTKNRKTVSAIGYALYRHGNQDDLNRMVKIEEFSPGRGLPNAISWLRYRLSDDKTNPGPAAAPPHMQQTK